MKRAALALAVALMSAGPLLAAGGMEHAEQPGFAPAPLPEGLDWAFRDNPAVPPGFETRPEFASTFIYHHPLPTLLGELDGKEREYQLHADQWADRKVSIAQAGIFQLRTLVKERLQARPAEAVASNRALPQLRRELQQLQRQLAQSGDQPVDGVSREQANKRLDEMGTALSVRQLAARSRVRDIDAALQFLGHGDHIAGMSGYILAGQRHAPNAVAIGLAMQHTDESRQLKAMIAALRQERALILRYHPELAGRFRGRLIAWRRDHGFGPHTDAEKALLADIKKLERQYNEAIAAVLQYGGHSYGGIPRGVARDVAEAARRQAREIDGQIVEKQKQLQELRGY
ncbi:MAG: hypothetical protein KGO96_01080 [Elusimicrobia bacterium]|nr:hypothetical protein [Elusimicrobiota bacterium]MDE2424487.1 hypothetical protein [Elusimicrobiota bacterium]